MHNKQISLYDHTTMSNIQVSIYGIADRIINILDVKGEVSSNELMNDVHYDTSTTGYVLNLLFGFGLIEYDKDTDSVRLTELLRLA